MQSSFYDSAGQPKLSTAPPDFIVGDELGHTMLTASSSGAGDKLSLTIKGDGVNPTWIESQALVNGAASSQVYFQIRDGAGGTGTHYGSGVATTASGGNEATCTCLVRVPPFTGTKTIYMYGSTGGTYFGNATAQWTFLRATRMKTAGIYAPPSGRWPISTTATTGHKSVTLGTANHNSQLSVNANRVVVPQSGVYRFGAFAERRTAANAAYGIRLFHRNSAGVETIVAYQLGRDDHGYANRIDCNTEFACVAGDMLYPTVFSDSAQADGGAFWVSYIGPAVEVQNRSGQRAGKVILPYYNSAVAAGGNTGNLGSITVTGDGVSTLNLRAYFSHAGNSAGGMLAPQIWETSIGTGINTSEFRYGYTQLPGGNLWVPLHVEGDYPPFTGTKTFHATVHVGTAGTVQLHTGTNNRAENLFVATWV